MKIGIVSGGGECAGINSAIRAATFKAEELGHQLFGIMNGWKGLLEFEEMPLNFKVVDQIGEKAGTIICTSRTNPFNVDGKDKSCVVLENLRKNNYDYLIVIGGDDTLKVGYKVDELGFPVVGIPKTMDGDLQTYPLGFDTAKNKVKECIEALKTNASSNRKVTIIEVFGRYRGLVAYEAGVAAGADEIIIPEISFNINEVCKGVEKAFERRKKEGLDPHAIIIVAEGAVSAEDNQPTYLSDKPDSFGHKKLGGIGYKIEKEIKKRLGYETSTEVLSRIVRSGQTMSCDGFMGEKLGRAAVYVADQKIHGVAVLDVIGDSIKVKPIKDLLEKRSVNVDEISLYSDRINFGYPLQQYKPKIEFVK